MKPNDTPRVIALVAMVLLLNRFVACCQELDAVQTPTISGTQSLAPKQQVSKNEGDLITAAEKGDLPRVKALISAGVDVNAKSSDEDGDTALIKACETGYPEIVRTLISAKADVNAKSNETGETALIAICTVGRAGFVEVNTRLEIARAIVDANADVSARDKILGATALIRAYWNANLTKMLLDSGADKNETNHKGYTPLIIAAENGSVEVVKQLLDAGAEVNAYEHNNGETALIAATDQGKRDIVKMLVERGASINSPDHRDYYFLNISAPRQIWEAKQLKNATPLIYAARDGYTDIVKDLLEAGAKKEIKDSFGNTALKMAKCNNHADIVKILQDAGAAE